MLRTLQIFIVIVIGAGVAFALTPPSLISSVVDRLQFAFVRNHSEYDDLLKKWTTRYDIDCTLAKAMIYQENPSLGPASGKPSGAVGLMQVLPTTARLSTAQLFDPETNIKAGGEYLSTLMKNACPDKTVPRCPDKNSARRIAYCLKIALGLRRQTAKSIQGINLSSPRITAGIAAQTPQVTDALGKARWECEGELPETHTYVPRVLGYYNLLREKNGDVNTQITVHTFRNTRRCRLGVECFFSFAALQPEDFDVHLQVPFASSRSSDATIRTCEITAKTQMATQRP